MSTMDRHHEPIDEPAGQAGGDAVIHSDIDVESEARKSDLAEQGTAVAPDANPDAQLVGVTKTDDQGADDERVGREALTDGG